MSLELSDAEAEVFLKLLSFTGAGSMRLSLRALMTSEQIQQLDALRGKYVPDWVATKRKYPSSSPVAFAGDASSKTTFDFRIYFDGACRTTKGGAMSIGVSCPEMDYEYTDWIGAGSNVVAELRALEAALDYLIRLNLSGVSVLVLGDNESVIRAIRGKAKMSGVAHKNVLSRCLALRDELVQRGVGLAFVWIPREENIADAVSR